MLKDTEELQARSRRLGIQSLEATRVTAAFQVNASSLFTQNCPDLAKITHTQTHGNMNADESGIRQSNACHPLCHPRAYVAGGTHGSRQRFFPLFLLSPLLPGSAVLCDTSRPWLRG